MKLVNIASLDKRKKSDALVIPFWIDKGKVQSSLNVDKVLSLVLDPVRTGDFTAKGGELAFVYVSNAKEERIIYLGLGPKDDISMETMRKAYAAVVGMARKKKWNNLAFLFPDKNEDFSVAAVEGAMLANYSYDKMKRQSLLQDPSSVIESIQCIGLNSSIWERVIKKQTIVNAVNFTRDLVNGNADDVTPAQLCLLAKEMVSDKVKVTVLRRKELEKEKMGLLLAVGQGARHEPALIVIEYKGDPSSKESTAIVGKGITYDTGGLNLKISGSMETMKCDMAGAAAVLGVIKGASELCLKSNVIGVIASAENAIGPDSYKPGDVIIARSGRSVEVNDTDAEGRLVLADALSYVQDRHHPSKIIDLATLTGGVVIALGEEATALFCNHEGLCEQLLKSSEATFERLWRMPLYPEYRDALKSSIADTKNSGGRKASAGKGAIFLQQFIENTTPWAHLDIAGTAYLSETKVYHPTLATGVGVRLLLSLIGAV